jgi:hypothetical protein
MVLRNKIVALVTAISACLLAAWAYWPGLHGGFLFDDVANLSSLGSTGRINHWAAFWRYITSGTADPTGRPLALLSFLLDARDWPAAAFPFKRTNLVLHLCNAALLYTLLLKLGQALGIDKQRNITAAILAASLWLLHPLLVSTTLYIVQREAMLAATCVMAGLLSWLHGRRRLVEDRIRTGVLWSIVGLGGFTMLGTLAKANGSLLPWFALLVELIVLRPNRPMITDAAQRAHRAVMLILGWLPASILFVYVTWTGVHGLWRGGLAGIREWSISQRLLTEPRVLLDYLHLLWLPRPYSSGLFNDQYAVSTSWLHPASTLPAFLAIFGLLVGAWRLRQSRPALALAILFYFAGQWLESTSLPLELYFEHRNYTPTLLMFWPLGLWLSDLSKLRAAKIVLIAILPLTLAVMTRARAQVWGNTHTQALIWAALNPDSPRAQINAADIEMQTGHPHKAARRITTLLTKQPNQAQLIFNLLDAHCMLGGLQPNDASMALYAMRHTANEGTLFVRWFGDALPEALSGQCQGLTTTLLDELDAAGLRNPQLSAPGPQQDLLFLRGRIALANNKSDTSFEDFRKALDLIVRPDFALQAAATLGASGHPSLGLRLITQYESMRTLSPRPGLGMPMLHAWVLKRQHYWKHEIDRLKQTLLTQIHAKDEASIINSRCSHGRCKSHLQCTRRQSVIQGQSTSSKNAQLLL